MDEPPASDRRPLAAVVAQLRTAFADALREAGPAAPTLCEGWTAHDLAAHVVARQRHPLADVGLVVPALAGVTERARLAAARRPFDELLAQASGRPAWWSPFALPGLGPLADLVEYAVHTEDVRRGAGLPTPDVDVEGLDDALVRQLHAQRRLLRRRLPVALLARTSDGRVLLDPGCEPAVTMTGRPIDVLLYLTGRRSAADVDLTGDEVALRSLAAARLGI